MLPIEVSRKELDGLQQGKGKAKVTDEVDYSRLIYESSAEQNDKESVECVVNVEELTELLQMHQVSVAI